MSLDIIQNFYKDSVKVAWATGGGNFYLNTKPTVSAGYLVINPSSVSKREIVRYSATGTDGNGDYVTIDSSTDRGLGGTTEQTHAIGEAIRMNITAEHWAQIQTELNELSADISSAVLSGAPVASTTAIGVVRLTNSPDKTLGTATITIASPAVINKAGHNLTLNDRVKFSTTDTLPTGIVAGTNYYVISAGLTTDEFQISETLGGSAINTSGSQAGVHTLIRTTAYVVEDNDPRIGVAVTQDEKDAMVGIVGTPNTDNKFVTENGSSASGTDQSQTTQNSSVELGEANATTKKNKIAQSFIPKKNKIRGVKLYKSANTGTAFTGTVTVTLQSDSSGSPDGVALATKTFTNSEWVGFIVGEIEALFDTEYTSMINVPETTYWIVVESSTSDNSNHPNLGFNTAGGYSNGTLKYNNTADGWVEITGDDLYFKTLEGNTNQNVRADEVGEIGRDFFNISKMPVPAYQQSLRLGVSNIRNGASNKDGSIFVVKNNDSTIEKYTRDPLTGYYNKTASATIVSSSYSSLTILGDYIYYFYDGGNEVAGRRYNLSDLGGVTTLTMPVYDASGTNYYQFVWNDGVHLYLNNGKQNTTYYKLSISGSTLTQEATGTCLALATSAGTDGNFNWFDGVDVYAGYDNDNDIKKFNSITGASVTTIYDNYIPILDGQSLLKFIVPIDKDRVYVGTFTERYDEAGVVAQTLDLYPFTKV